MSKNKKPIGLTLIAVYSAFSGFFSLVGGGLLLLASAIPDMPAWITIVSLITTISGVLLLASVYGVWTLQSWGLNLTFWLYVVYIPLGILSIFPIYPDSEMTVGNTVLQLVGISASVLILMYLNKNQTKTLFNANEEYA